MSAIWEGRRDRAKNGKIPLDAIQTAAFGSQIAGFHIHASMAIFLIARGNKFGLRK